MTAPAYQYKDSNRHAGLAGGSNTKVVVVVDVVHTSWSYMDNDDNRSLTVVDNSLPVCGAHDSEVLPVDRN